MKIFLPLVLTGNLLFSGCGRTVIYEERIDIPHHVIDPSATTLNFTTAEDRIRVVAGQSIALSVDFRDGLGQTISQTGLAWKVLGDIGQIDADQKYFLARKSGTGTLEATIGEVKASLEVEVLPGHARTLEITPREAAVKLGERVTFSAYGLDEYGNRMAVPLVWEPDAGLELWSGRGIFETKKAGLFSVTARYGSLSTAARVRVE